MIELHLSKIKDICLNVINLQYLMEKDEVNFWEPGLCSKVNQGNYPTRMLGWLKLYYFATNIDITVFDQLQAQEMKRAVVGLDDLKADINKLDKLEKSKNVLINYIMI